MLGYEPAEMLAGPISVIVHPQDFALLNPSFMAFGRDRPNLKLTFRVRRKDNVYIWVEGQYRRVPEDYTSISVLRDMTVWKNAELLLAEANAKLEAANNNLRRLAEHVTKHKIRNACNLS